MRIVQNTVMQKHTEETGHAGSHYGLGIPQRLLAEGSSGFISADDALCHKVQICAVCGEILQEGWD